MAQSSQSSRLARESKIASLAKHVIEAVVVLDQASATTRIEFDINASLPPHVPLTATGHPMS